MKAQLVRNPIRGIKNNRVERKQTENRNPNDTGRCYINTTGTTNGSPSERQEIERELASSLLA